MLIEIKRNVTDEVIFSHVQEDNSLKITLAFAVKARADLDGAYLAGAYLADANLDDATYGIATLKNGLLQLLGKYWPVYIFDAHIKIGCQFHSTEELDSFTDDQISNMAGNAMEFWKENKEMIMTAAKTHQKPADDIGEEKTEVA